MSLPGLPGTPGLSGLPLFRETVRPEWIDYNGHMSEAFYVLVFGYATDALMEGTGMGPACRESTGCSMYTVESHIRSCGTYRRAHGSPYARACSARPGRRRASRMRCTSSQGRKRTTARWPPPSCSPFT